VSVEHPEPIGLHCQGTHIIPSEGNKLNLEAWLLFFVWEKNFFSPKRESEEWMSKPQGERERDDEDEGDEEKDKKELEGREGVLTPFLSPFIHIENVRA